MKMEWREMSNNDSIIPDEKNYELEKLRDKNRKEEQYRREQQRKFILKKVRHILDPEIFDNTSYKNIKSMAEALKNKSRLSCSLLTIVMNTLLESEENISVFLKVDGSLQALLRALSGQNEEYQLLAAHCICNLALGNERESFQVLKASETYLMAHLSGKNRYIIEACVIALGNFSKHGIKNIRLLQSQGFFPKVVHLLNDFHPDLQESSLYALTQMVYNGYDYFKAEDLENLIGVVVAVFYKHNSLLLAFLLSLLSSYSIFYNFTPPNILEKICFQALSFVKETLGSDERAVLYYFRIIGNCISEESGQVATVLLENHLHLFKECAKYFLISNEEYLQKEFLSLVGILLNHPSQKFSHFVMEFVNENFNLFKDVVLTLKICDTLSK